VFVYVGGGGKLRLKIKTINKFNFELKNRLNYDLKNSIINY
jgi:hypothetical protein